MLYKAYLKKPLWLVLVLALSFPAKALESTARTISQKNIATRQTPIPHELSLENMADDPLTAALLYGTQVPLWLKNKLETPFYETESKIGDRSVSFSTGLQVHPQNMTMGMKVGF